MIPFGKFLCRKEVGVRSWNVKYAFSGRHFHIYLFRVLSYRTLAEQFSPSYPSLYLKDSDWWISTLRRRGKPRLVQSNVSSRYYMPSLELVGVTSLQPGSGTLSLSYPCNASERYPTSAGLPFMMYYFRISCSIAHVHSDHQQLTA